MFKRHFALIADPAAYFSRILPWVLRGSRSGALLPRKAACRRGDSGCRPTASRTSSPRPSV